MSDSPQNPLQWLANHHAEEQRNLRNAEENLFNWTTSLFLAGLGALTGIRGMDNAMSWNFWWRVFLMLGVVAFIVIILAMAYLIRRSYVRQNAELSNVLSQLHINPPQRDGGVTSELFFYVRWSALAALGAVTLVLIWMLG